METKREALKRTITSIKSHGARKGITIAEEEMAGKAGLSAEQLQAYLDDSDRTPDDATQRLRTAYADLFDAREQENNQQALAGILEWIRNLGLAGGMNITLEEMARRAGITTEQLYGYLEGNDRTPNDLYFRLRDAYRELLENVERVDIIEDIHIIKASGSFPFPPTKSIP